MDKIELNKCQKDKIAEICAEFHNSPGELINVLHKTQGHFGYLPEEVQREIARNLHIPVAKVYGVVTFYSFFTMQPKGRHSISVCMGTACYVRGAEGVLEDPGVPALRGRLRSGSRDARGREGLRPSGAQADQGHPRPVRVIGTDIIIFSGVMMKIVSLTVSALLHDLAPQTQLNQRLGSDVLEQHADSQRDCFL